MVRDIPYYTLADGLVSFQKYTETWRTFETSVSVELYEYGQLIQGWSKKEGMYDMGKLSKSYAENKGDLADFTTAPMRRAMIKNNVPFHIVRIADSISEISGNKQYILTLLFGKEFTYLDSDDEKQTMPAGSLRAMSLDSDKNRDDVYDESGVNYIGNELPYGPCILAQRGKYFRVEDVEDEVDENIQEAAEKEVSKSQKKARK